MCDHPDREFFRLYEGGATVVERCHACRANVHGDGKWVKHETLPRGTVVANLPLDPYRDLLIPRPDPRQGRLF